MSGETVYDFQWDPAKAVSNVRKHGVTFDQASTVFLDAFALTVFDEAHSEDEDRRFTLGYDLSGRLLAIAHTYSVAGPHKVRVRIIPAREATKSERGCYEDESR
jgi:uncharacterized protein